MKNVDIKFVRPGWYEVEEEGVTYTMELIWLSRLQRDLLQLDGNTSVSNWYNSLDEKDRKQIRKVSK